MVDTNRIVKGPGIDFIEFLRFIGIWMSIRENPGTKRAEYLRENPIDIFSGLSIRVNQFMSGNHCESNFSAINFTATPLPPIKTKLTKSVRGLLCVMVTCKDSSYRLGSHV